MKVLPNTINIKTRYFKGEAAVSEAKYSNGERFFQLSDAKTGEALTTITVNCIDYGYMTTAPDEIFVKNYSENEGLVDALLEAGFITKVIENITLGFAVNGVARARLAEQFA